MDILVCGKHHHTQSPLNALMVVVSILLSVSSKMNTYFLSPLLPLWSSIYSTGPLNSVEQKEKFLLWLTILPVFLDRRLHVDVPLITCGVRWKCLLKQINKTNYFFQVFITTLTDFLFRIPA